MLVSCVRVACVQRTCSTSGYGACAKSRVFKSMFATWCCELTTAAAHALCLSLPRRTLGRFSAWQLDQK